MEPNTRIKLTELTDRHVETIIGIFRGVGLTCDQEILCAEEIVRELESQSEYELRPTMGDISKMILTQKPFGLIYYVHVYITHNRHANAPESAKDDFDRRMRKEFIS